MSGIAADLGLARASGGAMLSLARREAPFAAGRISTADQLMAPSCQVVLPTLENIPAEQRFLADDREAVALAEILVKSDIAVVEDWGRSERDPTRYLSLTLQRKDANSPPCCRAEELFSRF